MTERRKRGVPLNDLDRDQAWVIAYTGRRWEVVGPAGPLDRGAGGTEGAPGAGAEGASTGVLSAPGPRREAARVDDRPVGQ